MISGLIHNTLVSFIIHGLFMLVSSVVLFFLLPLFVALPALIVLYAVFGYRYLTPLYKYNVVPLLPLSILLLSFAAVEVLSGTEMFTLMTNMPSVLTLAAADNLIRAHDLHSGASVGAVVGAAFLPSLLMYAGLRLKMWREAKVAPTPESAEA